MRQTHGRREVAELADRDGPQRQRSSSAGPGAVLELGEYGRLTLRLAASCSVIAMRRAALDDWCCRARFETSGRQRTPASAGSSRTHARAVSCSVVFVSVTALFGPGPVRALQASRRVGASPDAPLLTLGTWKTKAPSHIRLLSCHQPGSEEPHGIPPSSRGRSKTRRRGTFTLDVMAACLIMEALSLPGRRKRQSSTLLVQAVPHASRLRQMASGQGLAALRAFTPAPHCCLRPHARLAL
jgi:hypothetical protein